MPAEAIQKMGEVKMPEVSSAQLARLDPSVPYIILLPERTENRIVQELIAYLGKVNVMATVLVGNPTNFRLFANFPWNVSPIRTQADPHNLNVPDTALGKVFKRNFISAIHDDAEAAEALYTALQTRGLDSEGLTTMEAMIRCGIFRFQVLAELRRVPSIQPNPNPVQQQLAAPQTDLGKVQEILDVLLELTDEDQKKSERVQNDLHALAVEIGKSGVTSKIETEVLKLQNAGILMSGVMSQLRALAPAHEVKAPRKRATSATKKARTTRKKA